MTAVTEPKDVTEFLVRVSCDRMDGLRFGVFRLKFQNETAAITLHDTVDTTRRAKTILRNTRRYSNDSLHHCEEVEKQIRVFISHTWRADHECDHDRRAAWMFHNAQTTLRSTCHSSSGRARTTTVKLRNSLNGVGLEILPGRQNGRTAN